MNDLFVTVLRMSLAGSVVILAVMVLRLCLRRVPRIFSYLLWSVVLVRLLCPVSFSAPVSVLGWVQTIVSQNAIVTSETQILSDSEILSDAEGAETIEESIQTTVSATTREADVSTVPGDASNEMAAETADNAQSWAGAAGILNVLTAVWIAGMVCMLGYGAFAMARLRRRLVCSTREQRNVYLADDLEVPCVVGLVRPRIYLPSGMETGERDCVLRHEQHHIRRGDPVLRFAAFLALCVHWFNPFAWAAYGLSGRDMEISCDEAVLREADGDIRATYAAVLLNMTAGRRLLAVGALPFAEEHPESRIRHIMDYRKPAFWAVIGAAVLCVAAIVCLAANPAQEDDDPDTAQMEAAEQSAEEALAEAERTAMEADQAEQSAVEAEIAEQEAIREEEQEEAERTEETEAEEQMDETFAAARSDGELAFDELIAMVKDENWNRLVEQTDINDWRGFANFTEYDWGEGNISLTNYLYADYIYGERSYQLQVYYVPESSTEEIQVGVDSIDSIYLFETDSDDLLLLYRAYKGIQADIDSFLSQSYDIFEGITMDSIVIPGAPTNAAVGLQDYKVDMFLGFDGCLFDFDPGIEHGESMQESWYSAGGIGVKERGKNSEPDEYDDQEFVYDADGKLSQVQILGNHMEGVYVESFDTEDFTGLLYEYDFDIYTLTEIAEADLDDTAETTSKFWVVFLDSGVDEPTYVVFFNERCFGREQALSYAQTVRKR